MAMLRLMGIFIATAAIAGCADDDLGNLDGSETADLADFDPATMMPLAECDAPPSAELQWDRPVISKLATALASPYHGAADVVTNPGEAVTFSAQILYGIALDGLENETVLGYIELGDCQWLDLGVSTTDHRGVATFDIPEQLLQRPGAYNVEVAVRGDDSRVRGTVWVLPERLDVVVFDIDGTLTTKDRELFEQLVLGSEPEMYESANVVVERYTAASYFPVYLTARPVYLDLITRYWLAGHDFPPGALFFSSGTIEGKFRAQSYKYRTLVDLQDRTALDVVFAYGNATSDICAYAQSGIHPADTFIIGDHAGDACEPYAATEPLADYPSHLAELTIPLADNSR